MTFTTSHIRIILTIAVIAAVAPLCSTSVVCGSCAEATYFAGSHRAVGEIAKRPTFTSIDMNAMRQLSQTRFQIRIAGFPHSRMFVVAPPPTPLRI